MKNLYKNKDYCIQELLKSRNVFGNKNTTRKQYDAMQTCLAGMYLYCPEELQDHVYTHLLESEKRKFYYENIWSLVC